MAWVNLPTCAITVLVLTVQASGIEQCWKSVAIPCGGEPLAKGVGDKIRQVGHHVECE